MRFSTIFTGVMAVSLVVAQTVPQQIVSKIGEITGLSDALRVQSLKITVLNAVFEGPKLAPGFAGIIKSVGEAVTMLGGVPLTDTLSNPDAILVVQALTTFVQIHQKLLNAVIGNHGIATMIPFFGPIRLALVNLEEIVDSVAFKLIALIPTQKTEGDAQFSSLKITITQAKTVYAPIVVINIPGLPVIVG